MRRVLPRARHRLPQPQQRKTPPGGTGRGFKWLGDLDSNQD
ncbi:unnamed protein product [Pararhodospirillum photometricum DSM 122]|uniref:Uncharacterized protein n=1 Tax=Pararhodospirillum photometricum DSM 122 TaxID=1150469 RepID=H6SQV5_PARPM|nr:unnamed protein product [Pararhodospirillum photometricum DSM 122]